MPTETNINSINLFQTQADYETNKASLSENDLVAVAIGDRLIPVGTIISYAGNAIPNGFLDCSGASLSPSTYTNLFGVIGTTYGGDGTTTFNLPNLNNNSFLEGSDTVGIIRSAGLPNITGSPALSLASGIREQNIERENGAFQTKVATYYFPGGSPYFPHISLDFDASRCSSVYGNSTTVQPKSVTVKYCIKY